MWGVGFAGLLVACIGAGACSSHNGELNDGHSGQAGTDSGGVGTGTLLPDGAPAFLPDGAPVPGTGDSGINPGVVTASSTPFDTKTAFDAARKVKNLLIGLPPTDAEVATLVASGAAGLQQLIINWTTTAATQPLFQAKMMFFFRNAFQQIGFTPTVDFQPQLLQNGGFDFGPLGTAAVGDDAFARLVQNLQDSFAMTAWQLVQEGQPFTQVLTTQRYMMTTGLKSLYLQIEMPDDQPYSFNTTGGLKWKLDYVNTIPLTDSLNPSSPNYMVFDDEPPAAAGGFSLSPDCHGVGAATDGGMQTVVQFGGSQSFSSPTGGYAQLFQRLLGFTPRWPFLAQPLCWEHASKPYFTDQDMSDWTWVTVTAKAATDAYIQPYDLPTLRTTTTLPLALPRIGFYTTPAFLALWNTNGSNQHRVTANQTLLAALGESFTSEDVIVPISETGLDSTHSVTGTDCLGCHKELDPLRQFWANQFDFNDRNDFPAGGLFSSATPNPRPAATGGVFAFATVNSTGNSMLDLGPLIQQVTDGNPTTPLNQFAYAVTQNLCFYANSTACDVSDPLFRQIAMDFQNGSFNFPSLVKEFFASTIVTGVPIVADAVAPAPAADAGPPPGEAPISISRRDHFCDALSNRLGIADICSLAVPLPTQAQTATATIAGSVAADSFSRGAQSPVTPSSPNLFFRAGVEELCENLAPQVVDNTAHPVYSSTDVTDAIAGMVTNVMGYPPTDPHYAQAVSILTSHDSSASTQGASNALRSTFVLACESPTSVSIGL
jgi:hypothetical protein